MAIGIAAGITGAATGLGQLGLAFSNSGGGDAPGLNTLSRKLYANRRHYQRGWQSLDTQQALWAAQLQDQLAQNQLFGNAAQSYAIPHQTGFRGRTKYRRFDIGASEGQLAMMARAQPALQEMQRADALSNAANAADVYSQYSPQIYQAGREYDPRATQLSDALVNQAQAGINSGGQSAYEDRYLSQQIRGGQAARGMGFGNADLYQEAVGLDRNRQERQIRWGEFGNRVLGIRHATTPDAASILFRGGGGSGYGAAVGGAYGANSQQGLGGIIGALGAGGLGGLEQNAYAMNQSVSNQNANSLSSALGGLGSAAFAAYNAPNPYFGMDPGSVPYNYGGDPSSAYRYR
jgi:hypothetical protein